MSEITEMVQCPNSDQPFIRNFWLQKVKNILGFKKSGKAVLLHYFISIMCAGSQQDVQSDEVCNARALKT